MTSLDSMKGNRLLKEHLKKSLSEERIAHAYLFTGAKGLGKKTAANAFVLEMFCMNRRDGHPCLQCPECKKILSGNHPDVIRVTKEGTGIGVDTIRERVVEAAFVRPFSSERRVFVIEEADTMTVQAQNALLKTLEEPPDYAVLLLLAEEEKRLLDTILSRVIRLRMEPVRINEITELLRENGGEGPLLKTCAAFSGGNPGKALTLLKDERFRELMEDVMGILRDLSSMNGAQIGQAAASLAAKCRDPREITDLTELWLREVLLSAAGIRNERKALPGASREIDLISERITPEKTERLADVMNRAEKQFKANLSTAQVLEVMLINMREIIK